MPVPQSALPRLLRLASVLRPGTLNVLVDNQAAFLAFQDRLPKDVHIGVFIKIDTGYHRAGIQTTSPAFRDLVNCVVQGAGQDFKGFYSHYGHSYGGSSEDDAFDGLLEELSGLHEARKYVPSDLKGKLVLTVGATPTATAVHPQHPATSTASATHHAPQFPANTPPPG